MKVNPEKGFRLRRSGCGATGESEKMLKI